MPKQVVVITSSAILIFGLVWGLSLWILTEYVVIDVEWCIMIFLMYIDGLLLVVIIVVCRIMFSSTVFMGQSSHGNCNMTAEKWIMID